VAEQAAGPVAERDRRRLVGAPEGRLGPARRAARRDRARRWAAYRRAEDRERFLVGCALAKAALARYTGRSPADVRFDRTCGCGEPHGKPAIAGGGPGHSVAHSGDLIAVAVAGAPVGVDVEQAEGAGTCSAVTAIPRRWRAWCYPRPNRPRWPRSRPTAGPAPSWSPGPGRKP
jgi:Phosphopantetheinyl transferase